MIAWHGITIMRVVKFGEWYHLAHPMAYAGTLKKITFFSLFSGAILVGIFAFILVFSTFLSCFIEGFLRPIFGFKVVNDSQTFPNIPRQESAFTVQQHVGSMFLNNSLGYILFGEEFFNLWVFWNFDEISHVLGLVAVAFGFYWLMVTFTCIWGVFHLKSNNGESWTWLISSASKW